MPKIYDRSCDRCGNHYKKAAKYFCSYECSNKGKNKGIIRSEEYRAKCRKRILSPETIEKIRNANVGKKYSLKTRRNKSVIFRGKNNPAWKGGITPLRRTIRRCLKMRLWIKKIFERDDYTCLACGKRGGDLHADHIKTFASILDKFSIRSISMALKCNYLWDISNGQTLCKSCHKDKTHKERIIV